MGYPARTLLPLLALLAAPALAQEPDEELVRRAADALGTIGYEVDLSRVSVEAVKKKALRGEVIAHAQALGSRPHLENLCAWLQGMGRWRYESADEMLEIGARELASVSLAYYVPERKAMVVVEDQKPAVSGVVRTEHLVAHELVHAWRDQRSDLQRLLVEGEPTLEQRNIRSCLTEGEATYAALALQLLESGRELGEVRADDLQNLFSSILTPGVQGLAYEYGSKLAHHRWQRGGWPAVRELWSERPTSTEQILHLDKLGRDQPTAVELPAWPPWLPAAELLGSECLGEMELYATLLRLGVSTDEARVAAAGWDGDRLGRYRTEDGESALVWRSVWDRELDARQFYAALAEEGDGEWRLEGRVLDWVRTVDGALAGDLLELLAESAPRLEEVPEDRASTAAVEAAWADELGESPFISEGRWVHPREGFSLPVPEGWRQQLMGETAMLLPGPGEGPGTGLMVVAMPNLGDKDVEFLLQENLEQLERMGVDIAEGEVREVAGREMLWIVGELDSEQPQSTWMVMFVSGRQQVVISANCVASDAQAFEPMVDGVFAGLRFGLGGVTRPAEDPAEEDRVPSMFQGFTVRVLDGASDEPCANQEVWLVPTGAIGHGVKPTKAEELAPTRGRRFRTNREGELRASYRDRSITLVARAGDELGLKSIWVEDGDRETLRLFPLRTLVVRVVDAAGEPQRGVPVGILSRSSHSSRLKEEQKTRTRKGEATWEGVFNQIHGLEADDELYVTFAFPVADPPRIRIRPEDGLTQPITLTLPPTGSLRVKLDPESVARDELVYRSSSSNRPMYSVAVLDRDDRYEVRYGERESMTQRRTSGGEEALFLPYVGLGLELEVSLDRTRESVPVQGPVAPGEAVEVVLEPGEIGERDYSSGVSRFASIEGRCLDRGGEPIGAQELHWRLSWTPEGTDAPSTADGVVGVRRGGTFEIELPTEVSETLGPDSIVWGYLTLGREPLGGSTPGEWSQTVPIRPGSLSLRDLRERGGGEVITARVVDTDGAPVAGAECELRIRWGGRPDGEQPGPGGIINSWSERNSTTSSDGFVHFDTGSFRDGNLVETQFQVPESGPRAWYFTARAPGYFGLVEKRFDPAVGELVFILTPLSGTAFVSGTLLLSPEALSAIQHAEPHPRVRVERLDGLPSQGERFTYEVTPDAVEFRIVGLLRGGHRLHVELESADARRLDEIDGSARPSCGRHHLHDLELDIVSNESRVLGPIDLREALYALRVGLHGPDGAAPAEGGLVTFIHRDGSIHEQRARPEVGSAWLLCAERPTDVHVRAQGYRPLRLPSLGEDIDVTLQLLLQVRLILDPEAELPDDSLLLQASLGAEGGGMLRGKTLRTTFEDDGALFLLDGPGSWQVGWNVRREAGEHAGSRRVTEKASRHVIEVVESETEQVFRVAPPSADALAKAADKLKR